MTTSGNAWLFRLILFFLEQERNPKENPLNVGKDLEEDLLN